MASAFLSGAGAGLLFVFVLALPAGASAATGNKKERCVPDTMGEWRCGVDINEADAAPLARPQNTSAPPVMLIDPARFGERDAQAPTLSEGAVQAELGNKADDATPKPSPAPQPTFKASEVIEAPAAQATSASGNSGNFSVQLALAASPRGFDALLKSLGPAARNSERRRLADGRWLLLLGRYESLEQARAAIPAGSAGAFARDTASLQFD